MHGRNLSVNVGKHGVLPVFELSMVISGPWLTPEGAPGARIGKNALGGEKVGIGDVSKSLAVVYGVVAGVELDLLLVHLV